MKERIKRYIYFILLTNIAVAGFQLILANPTFKILLAIYTMITLLLAIVYIKKA